MNEKIVEILIAITFLFLGIFFVISDILKFLGAARGLSGVVFNTLSWIIFILATITAILIIKNAVRKEEN